MTTGRINQVCQMLLNCKQIHEAMYPFGSAAKVQLFTTYQSVYWGYSIHHPVSRTYNLTPMRPATAPQEVQKHNTPERTQTSCAYQADAQYPESFDDHKETQQLSSRGTSHCTKAFPFSRSVLVSKHDQPRNQQNVKKQGSPPCFLKMAPKMFNIYRES